MKKIIILLLTLIAFEGCARATNRKSSQIAINETTATVNDEKPDNYYDRYLFRVLGDCKDTPLYFHYLNSEEIPLKVSTDGKPIIAKLEVFLNKDHTFSAKYEERTIQEYVKDGYRYGVTFKKHISSTWEVNKKGDVVLNSLGIGSPTLLNRYPSLIFKITEDLHQPGLKGQLFFLTMTFTSGDWELIDSHCKNKVSSEEINN